MMRVIGVGCVGSLVLSLMKVIHKYLLGL